MKWGMGKTIVWLVDNIEGQKYVQVLESGFQVFSLFHDVIQPQPTNSRKPLKLKLIPEGGSGQVNKVMHGGTSLQNVLLQARTSKPQKPRKSFKVLKSSESEKDAHQPCQPEPCEPVPCDTKSEVSEPCEPVPCDPKPCKPKHKDEAVPLSELSVNPLVGDDDTTPAPRRLNSKGNQRKRKKMMQNQKTPKSGNSKPTDHDEPCVDHGPDGKPCATNEDKVNVVVTMKQRALNARVRVDFIPLIYDDDELQHQEIKECIVDRQHAYKCSMFVREDFDYDIRISNIGSEIAEVELYATNQGLTDSMDSVQAQGGQFASGNVVCSYWGIGVFIVGLFALFMNGRNKRRRRRVMAAHRELNVTLVEPESLTIQ